MKRRRFTMHATRPSRYRRERGTHGTATRKKWYDREPLTIFVPLSVVVATLLQTIAYTGYKLFYNSFGVRPEEVGYDYTSLFPRAAIQIAILLSIALVLLATLSIAVALYGAMGYGMVQIWRDSQHADPQTERRQLRFVWLGLAGVVLIVVLGDALGVSEVALYGVLAVPALALLAEHVVARDTGTRSALDVIFEPRVYRSPRRLILIATAVYLPTLEAADFPLSVGTVLTWVVLLFILDRMMPVLRKRGRVTPPGGGTSSWLRRTAVLALVGGLATGTLGLLSLGVRWSELPERVTEVRSGEPLTYDLGNPLALAAVLAEPRADRVSVRWIGASEPPRPLQRRTSTELTYFGQNNGTSVFFAPGRPGTVYRWPTAAITMEAADTGDVPS